jgi:hypothetical protein
MELERYTITPVIAVPALTVTAAQMMAGRHRARLWHDAATGVAFTVVFVAMEALWMAWIVAKPWPRTSSRDGGSAFRSMAQTWICARTRSFDNVCRTVASAAGSALSHARSARAEISSSIR